MTDENKDICPETPENPDLPETPEAAPEEPKEVVSWYIPKEPQGREVVSYYVQRDPMPQNVWQQAAKKEKRRSRLWLWISLAVLAVTVAAVVLAAILGGSSGSGQHRPLPDGDGDNPSSIVDIFGSKATTIPRIQGDKGVRLACRDPQSQPLTAQEVYAKVNPSVVTVVSEQSEGASIGTGVIMTSDGYIITNAHVISGGKSCWVALDTGVTYEVNLVGFDEEEDLAVLKADPQNPLPAAEFGNSDLVQVGDTALCHRQPPGGGAAGHHDQRHHLRRQPRRGGGRQDHDPAADQRRPEQRQLRRPPDQRIRPGHRHQHPENEHHRQHRGHGGGPGLRPAHQLRQLRGQRPHRQRPLPGRPLPGHHRHHRGKGRRRHPGPGHGGQHRLRRGRRGIQAGDVILAADGQAVSVTSDLLTVRRSHIIGDTVTLTILRDGQQFDVEVTLRSNRSFG